MRIRRDGLVLDVGSGSFPNRRADVLCERSLVRPHRRAVVDRPIVVADVKALPFRDEAFEFVIASHLAEHVDDPTLFGRELGRVASGGYVETPSPLFEALLPEHNHLWRVLVGRGPTLVFRPNQRAVASWPRLRSAIYSTYYVGKETESGASYRVPPGLAGRVLSLAAYALRGSVNRSGLAHTRFRFAADRPLTVRVDE